MKKITMRRLCLVLAVLLVLSSVPVAFAYTGVDDWAAADIRSMEEKGLIPDSLMDANLKQTITRQDMSRIAVLALEQLTGNTLETPEDHPFTDTADPDVEKACTAGIVTGDGNGAFRPEDPLTRLEFFAIVQRFLTALDFPFTEEDHADLDCFGDAASLPEWGREYASVTVGLGIVNGDGSGLGWARSTSCQEALVLFWRACQKAMERISFQPEPFPSLAQWAEESILAMDSMGLIPENIRYSMMDGAITRQDLCKVLMCSYRYITGVTDEDLGQGEDVFEDTDDADVLNAYRLGIVNGRGNGIFSPEDPIIRQDFFTMSVNFLHAIGFPFSDDETVELTDFVDGDEVSGYASGATRLLVGMGIVNGTTDKHLNPRNNIACQEALLIFWRIFCFVTGWDGTEPVPPTEPSDPTEPPETTEPSDPTEPPETTEPSDPTEPSLPTEPTEPTDGDVQELCMEIVEFAKSLLGCRYTAAGKDPETGFDCSGFVYYVHKNFGYTLYPGATNQWNHLSDTIIPVEELRPGDLVFFSNNGQVSGMTHVGIYIGDGKFIHAENYENGVTITPLDASYYSNSYLGAKRVVE